MIGNIKYISVLLILFFLVETQAQTYVIADANFRNYLSTNIPSVLNSNKELIISNAKSFTGVINCGSLNIQDLSGIQYFYKITSLNCFGNKLTTLPSLDSLKQLQYLWAYNNNLNNLPKLNHLTNLLTLNVKGNSLTILPSLTGMASLINLDCSQNMLTTLPDLGSLTNLEEFFSYSNSITSVPSITNLTRLKIFNVENNLLTLLPDLSKNTQLITLQFDYNQIDSIPPLSHLPNLKELIFKFNKVETIPDLASNINLYLIMGSNNVLTRIPDLSLNSTLTNVELQYNQLSFEDVIPSSAHSQFITAFHIMPQDTLLDLQQEILIKGTSKILTLSVDANVLGSTYKWYKDNVYVTTTTHPSFTFIQVNETQKGIYICTVTNNLPRLSGIKLNIRGFSVTVNPCITFSSIDYAIINADCDGSTVVIDPLYILALNTPLSFTLQPLNNQPAITYISDTLKNVLPGRYSLIINDTNQCTVNLQNYVSIPVPLECTASFTPNGDGHQDVYFIEATGVAKIYSKNGTLVRTIQSPAAWDGSDQSGKLCSMGYYLIVINGIEKKGVVLID